MADNVFYDLLCCPVCQGRLKRESFELDSDGICKNGILKCECGEWFPIKDNIPRIFCPNELRPDFSDFVEKYQHELKENIGEITHKESKQKQVQDTFGFKWTRQNWWGMDGASAKIMNKWILTKYGWDRKETYRNFMADKDICLDAGCGLGRETFRMAKANPDALVVGLELSGCIDEVLKYVSDYKNVFFVQGDLLQPPFKKGIFDFIISEGVLHHTPDTKVALGSLVSLLKDEGELAFYIYRKKGPLREYADDYIRSQVSGLKPEEAWRIMKSLTYLSKALSDLKTEVEIPQDIPFLGIKAGRIDTQRFIYWNLLKCYWNDEMTFDENVLVNFDWYYPKYGRRHTAEEVKSWLSNENLELIHESLEEAGITVRARKKGI